jgi:hypothetical protein
MLNRHTFGPPRIILMADNTYGCKGCACVHGKVNQVLAGGSSAQAAVQQIERAC